MDWMQATARRLIADETCAPIAGDRWEWGERSQGTPLPAGVLELISDDRPQNLSGFHGRRESRAQVNCLAYDMATAVALREAAIAALVLAGDFYGIAFGRGRIENVGGDAERTTGGTVFRQRFDVLLWHD